jgi:hypothetical protein
MSRLIMVSLLLAAGGQAPAQQKEEPAKLPTVPATVKSLPPVVSMVVFKDGAFYFDFFGNEMLIPMIGGGASGCFGAVPERLQPEWLKRLPAPTPSK